MRLVAAPPAGLLVQRVGERRVYISGLVIVALSTGACAFARNILAAAAFPFARRPGFGDVHGVVAGSDDPDLTAGRARPRRGHVLVGVPDRVCRRSGAGQPDRRPGIGRAVRDLRRRTAGRRGGGLRQPAQFRCGAAGSDDGARRLGADGVASQGVSRRAVLQLRDGLGGVRPAHRAGAAVRRRRAGLRRGLRGSGAGDVRDRQHLGRHPQRVSVRPGRAAQAAHRRPDGVGGRDSSRRVHDRRCRCSWRRPW